MALSSFIRYFSTVALTAWTGAAFSIVASFIATVASSLEWVGVPVPAFPITAAIDLYTSNLMFYGHLGAFPAIEMFLLVPVAVWVEFITWYLLMLVAFPIIASVSHHYKLAGDTCLRISTRYTECLPVNQPIEDARKALSQFVDLYKRAEDLVKKTEPWWSDYVIQLLRLLLDYVGIPLPESIEETVREGIAKAVARKIIGKIAGYYFLYENLDRCWKADWNSIYLGSATVCFSFLPGPHMLDEDPCLTWNPLLSGWHQPTGFRELLAFLGFWVMRRYIAPVMRGIAAFTLQAIERSLIRLILACSAMGAMILSSCVTWAVFEK